MIAATLDEEKGKELGREYEALFGAGAKVTTNPEPSPELDKWNAFKKEVEQQFQLKKSTQLNEIDQAYDREREIQGDIAADISLISPSSVFGRFVADLCGTSETGKKKYMDAVKSHQQTLENELFSQVKKTTLILPSGGTAVTMSVEKMVDLKSLPAFNVQRATIGEVIKANLRNMVSLAFWLIAPFAAAYVRFLKYDVR
jgi:hypothetical protein